MLKFPMNEEGEERKKMWKEGKEAGREEGNVKGWCCILGQKKKVCEKKRRCLTCYQEEKYFLALM